MSVFLSPLFNGFQGFTVNGVPNAGGLINTYLAGTSTPVATYTDHSGTIANQNPIHLDASGHPPFEIWLTGGIAYKFVVTDALGLNAYTYDNITGISAIDYLDVLGFGAKLDGVTDDTAAFTAALAVGGPVYVPFTSAGVVLSNLVVNNGVLIAARGMQLFAAAGSSYAIKVQGFSPQVSGFTCQDTGNTTSQTTTSAGASGGAASISVTSASQGPGIQIGQRIAIELSTGYWHATYVTNVAATTITLYTALPAGSTVNSAARVWSSFGFIYLTNFGAFTLSMPLVSDIIFPNCWSGIMMDSPNNSAQLTLGRFSNIRWTGSCRQFALVIGRNCNNNEMTDVKAFGGFSTTINTTGNGVTTQFSFPDNVFLTREVSSITVGGTPQVLGTGYQWVAASNRTVQFASAPGNGVAVAASGYSYGVEGFVEDKVPNGSNVFPEGGNIWTDCAALQFQRGWNFRNAQLWAFSNPIGDSCSDASYCFDACTYGISSNTNLFVGYAANGLRLLNSSLVKAQVQTWSLMPAGLQVLNSGATGTSGAAGNSATLDATSQLDFANSTALIASSQTQPAASSTGYFGANGYNAGASASVWLTPYTAQVLKLDCLSDTAPGAGQTFTYTLIDISSTVLATITASGASAFGGSVYVPNVATARDGYLRVKLVTSAGAALAFHRVAVTLG